MASAGAPNTTSVYNHDVLRQITLMSLAWGIVGMSMGVFIAAQLVWPALNLDFAWIVYSHPSSAQLPGAISKSMPEEATGRHCASVVMPAPEPGEEADSDRFVAGVIHRRLPYRLSMDGCFLCPYRTHSSAHCCACERLF